MKAGLLPLYVALYDESSPHLRARITEFYNKIADMLKARGVDLVTNEICRLEDEFKAAVTKFENEGCDAIFTLHLAYSPSLESAEVLANTKLPIIVIDTTDTEDFSSATATSNIMYCHGIHGVMDMCNLLKKNKKSYAIAAGYYEDGTVIDKAVSLLKAAASAKAVKGSKVGSIGGYFDGMGDFRIEDNRLKELFDVDVIYPKDGELKEILNCVTADEIQSEKAKNEEDFVFIGEVDEQEYTNSVKTDIALKKWIENNNLGALTINFRNTGEFSTMPFNGCCRAMQNGIGYAGEGDKFTAMFLGGLMKNYSEASFIEIFCPDWKNNTLMISHMGEINYAVADKKPTAYEMKFRYGERNPILATAAYKAGKGIFLNAFEDADKINLFITPVEVKAETTDNFTRSIRGWLDFHKPISEVLTTISEYGATHHSMLVYNTSIAEMKFFAECLGLNAIVIE